MLCHFNLIIHDSNDRLIHPALIEAAAVHPLTSEGTFAVKAFEEVVVAIAQRKETVGSNQEAS